jgi:hypothetical protein
VPTDAGVSQNCVDNFVSVASLEKISLIYKSIFVNFYRSFSKLKTDNRSRTPVYRAKIKFFGCMYCKKCFN